MSVGTEPTAPGKPVLGAAGFYHHHCGVGDHDTAALQVPAVRRDQAIIAELRRLETAQADLLLDRFGDVQPGDRLLIVAGYVGR